MNTSLPKLLILGCQGQVGSLLMQKATANGWPVHGFSHQELDITDNRRIHQVLDQHLSDTARHVILNTAAYTAVDKAESESISAMRINHEGARLLACYADQHQIPFIHLSTDYVFSGDKKAPYIETDPIGPLNQYGHSKWLGEEAIRQSCKQHLILRVSSIFSRHGINFLNTILRLAEERETLRVVADQVSCPTEAGAIAETLLILSKQLSHWGTYHYCSKLPVSWYTFATAIVQAAKAHYPLRLKEIIPIPATEYPTAAQRPLYSVLNCDKIFADYGITQPDWQTSLTALLS